MLRIRGDKEFWGDVHFRRLVKRSLHLFGQHAEQALSTAVREECPAPDVLARYHPWMKSSRMKGNKSLEMSLVSKFLVRGGGFVSMKDEATLAELGIVKHRTAFSGKASSEFVARSLIKVHQYVTEVLETQELKTVNLCMDGATVCHEQATCQILALVQ